MSGFVYAAQSGVEPVSAADAGQWGNVGLYNVQSGCVLTPSIGAMTVDLAAGVITHFGSTVAVAALVGAFTLVSDPTYPRWTWLCLSSVGAPVVVSGDAAAIPSVPSYGDRVPVALYLVQAGQTVANNVVYKIDKRVFTASPIALAGSSSVATSTTSTSAVDLVTISGLSIAVGTPFRVEGNWRKQALAANFVSFGIKVNATIVQEAGVGTATAGQSTGTQRAEDGLLLWGFSPRATSYLSGWYNLFTDSISATGVAAAAPSWLPGSGGGTALVPNATVTSIALRAKNDTASNGAENTSLRIISGVM